MKREIEINYCSTHKFLQQDSVNLCTLSIVLSQHRRKLYCNSFNCKEKNGCGKKRYQICWQEKNREK